MPFSRFFKRRRFDDAANALYVALVEQSRQPAFYRDLGVADTLEGRYDMIILHAYMLFRRLGKGDDGGLRELSQETFDFMFNDMDQNLREMGVTDTGIGKRVQRMAEAFYGRTAAYDKALGQGAGHCSRPWAATCIRASWCPPRPRIAWPPMCWPRWRIWTPSPTRPC